MGLFDFFFRSKAEEPLSVPVPEERLWVGSISGLIMYEIAHSGIRGIETWTVVIIEEFLSPSLYSGDAPCSETGRKCTLGECNSLPAVIEAFHMGLPFLEPMVQDLAFEVCRRAEPRWDEIIDRYYADAYGYEYTPKPPRDLAAASGSAPVVLTPLTYPKPCTESRSLLQTLHAVLGPENENTDEEARVARRPEPDDPYSVLGVSPQATFEQIDTAYFFLTGANNPTMFRNTATREKASATLERVKAAYNQIQADRRR